MKSKWKTILLASMALFLAGSLIMFPSVSLDASLRGLEMWTEIVFPSLLPFFITAELLIGFGVVKFIGVLFEPIMRPLFNVPGVGSFVWAMGMASGYPSGAKLSSRLRQEKHLTQIEAERLVSFTNASNPLFIFAAVSIGFFNDPQLGILLAVCHYLGNTLVGIFMRFHGMDKEKNERKAKEKERFSIVRAFKEMHQARIEDSRPFGKIFGDAVINSVNTLLMIGGFIIMFSVFTNLLSEVGISHFFAYGIEQILQLAQLPEGLALPLFSGLFEITLGAQLISESSISSFLPQAIMVSFILAFNGFSVQAQVASILAETDIRFAPYFFARLLHGVIASLLAVFLYKPLYLDHKSTESTTPVFSSFTKDSSWTEWWETLIQVGPLFTITMIGIAIVVMGTRLRTSFVHKS
ncbi:sporulation integral membrane protein YlbJ [Radiobacillus kanasensis]|uniref:sporulation integral membrane protein YlbJ n=1 Tax=Radiobacillus kanasensis TaxID=2844358 RepID=UPI001E52B4C6|nr:sporulation integral membrane protein YlbJ [Radiobacillus kanasensis]UFU00922.1 sporulation integral membrane protein YlbJ [Radiobacillus kanasensis]